jgi:histidyl-tRNA synthetase
VFRNEKPGPGRFRQFMQFDADTVGSGSPAADAEMCMMAADTMEALGIARGSYVVKVNNRKVLDGVREALGVTDDGRWLTVMRAVDKLDKFSVGEVRKLLGPGRWDGGEEGKGDFTKGAGLDHVQATFVLGAVGHRSDVKDDEVAALEELQTRFDQSVGVEGQKELRDIITFVGEYSDRIRIDPSVVRGLEYYTGPVYEVELLLDTKDEKGRPVRFGSVGGGGRYDGLVSRFRGEPVPATGFSIGVSRLQAALTLLGKLDTRPEFGPVVVTVFDRDRVADYQAMVAALRNAGIRAELYLGNPKNMGNQLKYADRRNSPCVIIQGSDEKARGEVQIKDLIEGAKAAAAIASNQEWRESRPAQVSCGEAELVAKVREVLARHDVSWG